MIKSFFARQLNRSLLRPPFFITFLSFAHIFFRLDGTSLLLLLNACLF